MPRVEFVNLSLNRLYEPIQVPPCDIQMSRLRSLVLNNTHLEWDSVETLLNLLPALEELHLSLNDYKNVLIDTQVEDDLLVVEELTETDEDEDKPAIGVAVEELNNNECECRSRAKNCKRSKMSRGFKWDE